MILYWCPDCLMGVQFLASPQIVWGLSSPAPARWCPTCRYLLSLRNSTALVAAARLATLYQGRFWAPLSLELPPGW